MKYVFLILTGTFLYYQGCVNHESVSRIYSKGKYIYLQNSNIELRFDDHLYCKAGYWKDGELVSMNDDSGSAAGR